MIRASVLAVLCLTFGATGSVAADGEATVRISGSTSVANSVFVPHQAEIENMAEANIDLQPNSSGAGIVDLAAGRSDIAMISSDLAEILEKTKKATTAYGLDEKQLQKFEIGQASIEFIVNSSNPVKKLSAEQIKQIFLGKIRNWKDVGGANADICLFVESRHGAMRTILERDFLGAEIYTGAAEVSEAPQVATGVARVPACIGFLSSATPQGVRQGTVTVDTDLKLVQHMALVTKDVPTAAVVRVLWATKNLKN